MTEKKSTESSTFHSALTIWSHEGIWPHVRLHYESNPFKCVFWW